MSKMPSMASLTAPISRAAPPQPLPTKDPEPVVTVLTSEQEVKKKPPSWNLCQVAVRMTKSERKRLQRAALDSDMTVQELVMDALREYRERRGLR